MIIDFHTHIGDFRRYPEDPHQGFTFDSLVARLDEEGIDKAVFLPIYASPDFIYPYFVLGDRMSIRDQVADAGGYRERLIPFGNLDPRWMARPGADFSLILDWFQEQGCRGIGEITANIPFDDPRVIKMVQEVGTRGWPVVFHGTSMHSGDYGLQDDPGSPRLERLLQQAPEAKLVGHGPGFWAEIAANPSPQDKGGYPEGPIEEEGSLPRLLRQYGNLYCDISAGSGYNALTRDREYGLHFLEEFQDRILFATDRTDARPEGQMPHLPWLKELLAHGQLTQAIFDKIACQNALALIGLG